LCVFVFLLFLLSSLSFVALTRAADNPVVVDVEDADDEQGGGETVELSEEQISAFQRAAEYERQKKAADLLYAQEEVEELAAQPKITSSPDAIFTSIFDNVVDQKTFLQGDTVQLVIGLHNKGKTSFNVTQIFAAIVMPHDFKQYVQNFTRDHPNVLALPNEQLTFLYELRPDPLLEPREWGLIATVSYTDASNENTTFVSTVYNSTVTLQEPESTLDAQTLFTYLLVLALLGLLAYGSYRLFASKSRHSVLGRSAGRSAAAETGTRGGTLGGDADQNEWLVGTAADPNLHTHTKKHK